MALKLVSNVCRLARSSGFARSSMISHSKLNFIVTAKSSNPPSIISTLRSFSTKLPEVATYEEIKDLPKRPEVILIDVREPNELAETGVVPTSINIPLGQVSERLSKDFPESEFQKIYNRKKPTLDTELIFMCKIGKRSNNAMEISRQLGYKNSRNYLGSWTEWSTKEGLPN